MSPDQDLVFAGHLSEGRLSAAFAAARGDIEQNPLSPYSHVALAHCFLLAGHPRGALDEATTAMALSGNETGCVFLRARVNFILGDFDLAHIDAAAVISQAQAAGLNYFLFSGRLLCAAALVELDRTKESMELLVLTPADTFVEAGRVITRSETFATAATRFTAAFPAHPLSLGEYPARSERTA